MNQIDKIQKLYEDSFKDPQPELPIALNKAWPAIREVLKVVDRIQHQFNQGYAVYSSTHIRMDLDDAMAKLRAEDEKA